MDLKDLRSDLEILCSDMRFSLGKLDAVLDCCHFVNDLGLMQSMMFEVLEQFRGYHNQLCATYDRNFPPKPLSDVIGEMDD